MLVSLLLFLFPLCFTESINVLGTPLEHCSQSGEATTGWYRNGMCTEGANDKGSHHICIDLHYSRLEGGNFCSLTGQPNWCDELQQGKPRVNWCVCQWAFARFLSKATCDDFDVNCEATNMEALIAYENKPNYKDALACLKEKCPQANSDASSGLTLSLEHSHDASESGSPENGYLLYALAGFTAATLLVAGYAIGTKSKQSPKQGNVLLNNVVV